jgi:hypothetical protein
VPKHDRSAAAFDASAQRLGRGAESGFVDDRPVLDRNIEIRPDDDALAPRQMIPSSHDRDVGTNLLEVSGRGECPAEKG